MGTRLLRIFQREVERQCRFAIVAADDVEQALATKDSDRLWYSVQAFLVAAGNISKLLWPPNPGCPRRADTLRKSLSVKGDSPLKPRVFRNHFEHFDERLERWAETTQKGAFIDSNVGPAGRIRGVSERDYLRNFESATWTVTFRGDSYHLPPLLKAVSGLWQRASAEASKPYQNEERGQHEKSHVAEAKRGGGSPRAERAPDAEGRESSRE